MATKRKSFKIWIALALLGAAVASLEIYDLHPEFSVGSFHSVWVGFRHMDLKFKSGMTAVPGAGGKKVMQRDYHLGPIQIAVGI
jgi:hypothetical protein